MASKLINLGLKPVTHNLYNYASQTGIAPVVTAMGDKIAQWLDLERNRTGIQPRANNPLATYTEVDAKYRPNSEAASFPLPVFTVPKDQCHVYTGTALEPCIAHRYLSEATYKLAVHPQIASSNEVPYMSEIKKYEKENIEVAPTASSRTLFAVDPTLAKHCVKTHFPLQITRSKRALDDATIRHSIAISNLAIGSGVATRKDSSIAFFPESLGISYGKTQQAWGFLVRDMTPYPKHTSDHTIMPLFSLYSPDARDPLAPSILEALIEQSNEPPAEFILNHIFYPLLKGWADVFLETGIVLEAHGQNTCIEINEEGVLGRMIFRDFDTYVNQEILDKKGLSAEGIMTFKNETTETKPQGSVLSLLFDQAMSVPFDRIADLAEKKYGVSKSYLQQKCQNYLRDVFPEGDTYFPKDRKTYNYIDNQVLAPGVRTRIAETGQPPKWR